MSRKGKLAMLMFIIGSCISIGIKAQDLQDSIPEPDTLVELSKIGTSLHFNQTQLRILPFRKLSAFGMVSRGGLIL